MPQTIGDNGIGAINFWTRGCMEVGGGVEDFVNDVHYGHIILCYEKTNGGTRCAKNNPQDIAWAIDFYVYLFSHLLLYTVRMIVWKWEVRYLESFNVRKWILLTLNLYFCLVRLFAIL